MQYGAALAMYLIGASVVDIILQGQWSSNAFLLYIKRTVLEKSSGIATKIALSNITSLPLNPHATQINQH